MPVKFTDAELEAYLDEGLDPVRAAQVEQALRDEPTLLARLSHINGRRDAGIHTLGEIWRRTQIGVPSVEIMGKYLAGEVSAEQADYILFRIEHLKCPYTIAMVKDLEAQQSSESVHQIKNRREKYFHSSAGLLKKKDE